MAVYRHVGLWHGGSNYGHGDAIHDLEAFETIEQACHTLEARYEAGSHWQQTFRYVAAGEGREPQDDGTYIDCVFTPTVGDDTEIHLYEIPKGETLQSWADIALIGYPDRIVYISTRGTGRARPA